MAAYDAGDDIGEVGLWIDIVQFGRLDERGQNRPVLGAAVGTREQGVLAVQRQGADGALDGVVVELDVAVIKEQAEAGPTREGVASVAMGAGPAAASS